MKSSLLQRVAHASMHAATTRDLPNNITTPYPPTSPPSSFPSSSEGFVVKEAVVDTLLPLSMIAQHLRDEPLLRYTEVTIHEAHSAIVRLHTFCKAQRQQQLPSSSSIPPPPHFSCTTCHKGYMLLDAREGRMVCSECGICSRGQMNVRPEYMAPPEVPYDSKGPRKRGVPGVPASLVNKMRAVDPGERRYSTYWYDLQHWNMTCCHLGVDELEEADYLLREWKATGGDSRDARIVAVLLYMRIRDLIPKEEDIRRQLRCHRPLDSVEFTPPSPTFACEHCGTKHHTKKAARFCRRITKCDR